MHQLSSSLIQIARSAIPHYDTDQEFVASTIGCIVDITQPIYRQKEGNYIVEIKLIDETFNETAETHLLIKYLSVYLISDNLEQLKLTSKIGDFLYLHKFMFSTWKAIRLRAKFYGSFQSLYQIYCGDLEQDNEWRMERKMGNNSSTTYVDQLTFRIIQLKNWLRVHFKDVFRPFLGVKIINNYCSLIEPFNMIAKVKKILKNQYEYMIFVQDANQNIFHLELKPFAHLMFNQNQWIYLRGIKQINTDKKISFLDTGRVISLPQFFAEEFELQSNYKAIYRKLNKLGTQKKQAYSLTQISLFDQKISTAKQIFQLQDQYQASTKKENIILQNDYLVKGAIVKYFGKIRLYHTDYQMIVDDCFLEGLASQEKKSTIEDKKLVYLYEGQLYLVDESISYKKQCLKIILFTKDQKSKIFCQKELQKLSNFIGFSEVEKKKEEVLKEINQKLEKLKQLSSFENPAVFVLEPIRSDKLIFRLVNTKIV